MKAILVLFDSVNRLYLPGYGCEWTRLPNFKRLQEKTVIFDRFYAGSLPCMPARRELHTGRYNFLHRSWGPLEPYDDSMPELLKQNGVYTHLVSDHPFYWADGGATYHGRYNSWEFERGQEGEPWKSSIIPPPIPAGAVAPGRLFAPSFEGNASYMWKQEYVNRNHMGSEGRFCQARNFTRAFEFLDENRDEDDWLLQIEEFDPHEPFFTPERFRGLYKHEYDGPPFDWPDHYFVTQNESAVNHIRMEYAALLSYCDYHLGLVLDRMDAYGLWKDTMLIVCTDHGFLMGEHDWWSKNIMPVYDELAHIPLYIWDPRTGCAGERRNALSQSIDLAPTILEFFDVPAPPDMRGKSLTPVVKNDEKIHDYILFGYHGKHVNITDGRYVYMRAPSTPDNEHLYEYTLMPTHLRCRFPIHELANMELTNELDFTKGVKCLKIKVGGVNESYRFPSALYDLETDPKQEKRIDDPERELLLLREMAALMKENSVPPEGFSRLGLHADRDLTREELLKQREDYERVFSPDFGLDVDWEENAKDEAAALLLLCNIGDREALGRKFKSEVLEGKASVSTKDIEDFAVRSAPENKRDMILYFLRLLARRS